MQTQLLCIREVVNQHSFKAGRSCLSQLLTYYVRITEALEGDQNANVIYTDFTKAFDKCNVSIAHKMRAIGITAKAGRWIFGLT